MGGPFPVPPPRISLEHMSITREAPQRASARDRHSSARAILWIVLVSYFLILLNNSIIFTGLPRIRADLGLSAAGAASSSPGWPCSASPPRWWG